MKLFLYINRIMSVLGKNPLTGFYYHCLETQNSDHWKMWKFEPWNYYEFGTGKGNSLAQFVKALNGYTRDSKIGRLYIKNTNIVGFDSFKGLPEIREERDFNPAWGKGQFSYGKTHIEKVLNKTGYKGKTLLIEGFYEKSLTEDLRESLKRRRPSIVNIDVDLYSSTKVVLNWLEPILQNGTIFHFDDIWEYLGNNDRGEIKAINEFNDQGRGKLLEYYAHGIPTLFGKTFIYSNDSE